MGHELAVHVSGPLACFTRPEYAAERVSYPVITPPAAVGLLSAIFWKPEFRWRVRRVWVLNEVAWCSMTRNEVSKVASGSSDGVDVTADRTQRHSLLLRDVEYVIFADIETRRHATDPAAKYRDQFRRRLDRGACFSRPYLGLQELHAEFRSATTDDRPNPSVTVPVGPMPLDLRFAPQDPEAPVESIDPVFWPALVSQGVLDIPRVEDIVDAR